ncbi:ankyrin repeat protein [Histomonas meleagridis]|uniref:ankyrin repeat protein n=1 Tax=Histomonas meleagridis TaxID=135588 RepID=UPI0035599AE1|nr:ankyrin repeat protein [Histomonas meleagridis]KAH0804356.1 ankyrin repeat protein [Histomonas meleagridis]
MRHNSSRGIESDPRQKEVVKAVIENDVGRLNAILQGMKPHEYTQSNYSFPRELFEDNPTSSSSSFYYMPLPISNVTLLHIAAYCDSLDVFIYLCSISPNFNTRTTTANSYHPLHYACSSAAYEVAFYILSIDPTEATQTPSVEYHFIYLASDSGDPDILNLLFSNGADINSPANKRNGSVSQAVRRQNIECLRILIKKGSKETRDQRDYTPLMLAITNYQFEAVPILLDSGEDPEYFAPDGKSALFLSCFTDNVDVVRLLCEKMRVVDIDPQKNAKGLIHYACMSYDPEIVKIVLTKNIEINRMDEEGRLGPWYLADMAKEEDIIQILEMLVDKGLNLNLVKNLGHEKNSDPLLGSFVIAIKKMMNVMEWMLVHGADPNMKMQSGKTIMEIAEKSPNRYIRQLFMKYK